jgi:hypothetical protein
MAQFWHPQACWPFAGASFAAPSLAAGPHTQLSLSGPRRLATVAPVDDAGLLEVATAYAIEPVWSALRQALGTVAQESRDRNALRTLMLIEGRPELRARHLQKQTRWTRRSPRGRMPARQPGDPCERRQWSAPRSPASTPPVAEVTRRVNGQSAIDCSHSDAHTRRRA